MKKLIAGLLVAAALPATAMAKSDHQPNPKSPAKACSMLRSADATAFGMQYKTFGKCVSEHAKARTRTTEAIKAQERAENTCKTAKQADAAAFTTQWGTGRNGFGKCVSTTAKAKHQAPVTPTPTSTTTS
jgi:hypothetical protein